jgi:hypothetical protein
MTSMPMGLSPAQLGLLMLSTQQPLGIGSGRLSGARGGPSPGSDPRAERGPATARHAGDRARTQAQPGGLASRYFNRSSPRSPYPQNYFQRQNRYFP